MDAPSGDCSCSSSGTDENQELDRNHEIGGCLSRCRTGWSELTQGWEMETSRKREVFGSPWCWASLYVSSFLSAIQKKVWCLFFFFSFSFLKFSATFPHPPTPQHCHVIWQMNSQVTTSVPFVFIPCCCQIQHVKVEGCSRCRPLSREDQAPSAAPS